MIGGKDRFYYIGGNDISRFVITRQNTQAIQSKPNWGEMPAINNLSFDVFNSHSQFSTSNTYSIFGGQKLQSIPVTIGTKQGAILWIEWKGFIENVIENYDKNTATITGITAFSKNLALPAEITLGPATPAQLSRDIFKLYNMEVDDSAYNNAIALQTGLIEVIVDPNLLESRVTLMELQKQLAAAGYARIYQDNGLMIYEVYDSTLNPASLFNLTDRKLMLYPKVVSEENLQPQPYTVETLYGQARSKTWFSGSTAKTLDFGPNAIVKITSLSGGQQCADQWELIDKIKTRRIETAVPIATGNILTLQSYFSLTWEQGFFNNTPLELIQLDRTDPRYTKIIGRTLP